MIIKKEKRDKRRKRIRKNVSGTVERPRMAVFKSNKTLYVQIIDDTKGETLFSMSTKNLSTKGNVEKSNLKSAMELGTKFGEAVLKKKIKTVVFDRGGYRYHGKVKSLAEGARKAGLVF
jgi:large subunit ribosomal protein L18